MRSPSREHSRRERSVEKRNERRRNPSPPPKRKSPERKRSPTPKRRSLTPKRRSVEKRRSPTPKKRTPERKRSPSPRRRTPERRIDSRRRDRTPERPPQRYAGRKRSASRSKSPVQKKSSRFEPNPRENQKNNEKQRSLSYSPARRNPERYKEILESKKSSEKPKKQTGPVVKLHPTDSDHESSGNEPESSSKVDDYLFDKNQEKELNRLKALKSELAAKAKESLERKLISESASGSQRKSDTNPIIQQVTTARVEESSVKDVAPEKKHSKTRKSRSRSKTSRR